MSQIEEAGQLHVAGDPELDPSTEKDIVRTRGAS